MVFAHTESEKKAMPPPLSMLGFSTAAHAINWHKFLTCPVVLSMMYYFDNWTQPAVLYCLLHSIYCVCWLTKHHTFRDLAFDKERISFGFFSVVFLYVDLYWLGPYMLMKHRRDPYLENWELAAALILWGFGLFLHFASDSQKFFTLAWRGRGLITAGLFSWTRNPNYLGELLIYCAYCLLSKSRLAWLVLFVFVTLTFIPNMFKKDKSLAKYPEFEDYKKKTWMFIPFLF